MRELAIRHPQLIGAAFAVLVGWAAFNAFRAGQAVGEMGILDALDRDATRIASESLGG